MLEEEIKFFTRRIRLILLDYVELGHIEMSEFLYSSESKEYNREMVAPKMASFFKYIKVAVSCLKSENCDAVFLKQMVEMAVQILVGYATPHFFSIFD